MDRYQAEGTEGLKRNCGHLSSCGLSGLESGRRPSVRRFRRVASLRFHIPEITTNQDGREHPADPGESDDGVKDAADS